MISTFQEMMDAQKDVQRAIGGDDPLLRSPEAIADFVREMSWAMVSELNEAMQEFHWKSWSRPENIGTFVNRDAFVGELLDMLQFWMNLAMIANLSAEEAFEKMHAKHQLNHKRVLEGTNGTNKCPKCKRALDDAAVLCSPGVCTYADGPMRYV